MRYNVDYAAQLVTVDDAQINISFFNRSGRLIDSNTVRKKEFTIHYMAHKISFATLVPGKGKY